MAVLMGCEAVDDFVERAVAAAGDHEAAILGRGARCDLGGMAGAGRFGEVSINAARGKDVARLIEQTATRATTVPGVRVVDQQGVLEFGGHLLGFGALHLASFLSFYIMWGEFAHALLGQCVEVGFLGRKGRGLGTAGRDRRAWNE